MRERKRERKIERERREGPQGVEKEKRRERKK